MVTGAQSAFEQVLETDDILALPEMGQWQLVWRRFRRHKLALISTVIIIGFVVVTGLAPVIAPYDRDKIDLLNIFASPTMEHWLGTDELGRDTLTRLLFAGQISLMASIAATALSVVVGIAVGALAGYYRGATEAVLMRFTDIMLTLPTLPLLLIFSKMLRDMLALQQLLGPNLSVAVIVSVLTFFGWMQVARLVYSSVLSLREREFAEATRALGASGWRIIVHHLVPNSLAPIIVAATLGLGSRIIAEAALSFLGLGITLPTPSWGNMLTGAQSYMWRNPWLAFYPGLCIFVIVLAFNFVGDALRDALDPRMKIQ
ncbi:MAG: ABC transporter permease [Dehalococcoidales bacterium]|nr:ABC transporter permease [Dehalococcoidales bacterium]